MAITHKDINTLTEQTSINGLQKIPVTNDYFITFNRLLGWIAGNHSHNYGDLGSLPAIYNARHRAVPDTNFNNLFAYNSDIWCCRDTMTNAPKDRGCIDTNPGTTTGMANNIIIQYGNIGSGQQTQMLLITNQNNGIYKVGDIFTRTKEGDNISLWQKILVFEDYNNLKNDINYLANSINNVSSRKQDKRNESVINTPVQPILTDSVVPQNNRDIIINVRATELNITINNANITEECIIYLKKDLSFVPASTVQKIKFNWDSNYYKVGGSGVLRNVQYAGVNWIVSLYKGVLMFNRLDI